MYWVRKEQDVKAEMQLRQIIDLKYSIKFNTLNALYVENLNNFPNEKRVLNLVRSGVGGQQIWVMTDEANHD